MKKVGRPPKVKEVEPIEMDDKPTIELGDVFQIEGHLYKVTYRELKNRDHINIVLDLEA